ncbi:hypothetical protein K8R03_04225 [Candidatus Kaiserbacteria bacterium]|nr:hypothetical protein [Candidatus Kaiserbacteria bacterium]
MSALIAHRSLLRIALSAAHAFAWVAVFQFFLERSLSVSAALSSVVLTYALTHTVVVLLTPLAARHTRRGMKMPMLLATLSAAAAFAAFAGGFISDMAWGITSFALLMGVYRALYFVPYSLVVSKSTTSVEILVTLMPAAAGLLVSFTDMPAYLFACASAVLALSTLPLARLPERHEGFSWTYRGTFHELVAPENRRLIIAAICGGIEGAVLLLLWPIAVWMLLYQSYPLLGIVLSVTLLLTMLVRGVLHRAGILMTPVVSTAMAASGWIFRIFTANGGAVILVNIFSTAADSDRHGVDTVTHEQAADNHTFVDEFTALKEMGNAIGRVILCVLVGGLAPFLMMSAALAAAFLFAGAAGLLSLYVSKPRAGF